MGGDSLTNSVLQGTSVSLSSDGNTVAIGGSGDNYGMRATLLVMVPFGLSRDTNSSAVEAMLRLSKAPASP